MTSSRKLRAYLSGGMEYARNEGADWRAELGAWIERELGHSVFNPNVESARLLQRKLPGVNFRKLKTTDLPRYRSLLREIVELDSREIALRTDYVICLWDRGAQKGAGTKGEITLARYFNKPVYLVTRYQLDSIPGWILGCVTRTFSSIPELKEFLKNTFRETR